MGRTKKVKAGRLAAIKATAHKNLPVTRPTSAEAAAAVDDLLDQAEQCLAACELEEAARLCRGVLIADEFNFRALETLALIELESGDVKAARKLLNRCVAHCKPEAPPTVHLYLAQLADTAESSLKHFETALLILRGKLEQIQNGQKLARGQGEKLILEEQVAVNLEWSAEESEIRRSGSRALVGMTEIYLTDLCFDPTAEEKCLEYLTMASSLDPTDPEPLQTLASVRISQGNMDAAKEALRLSWALWREKPLATEDETAEPSLMDEDNAAESVSEKDDVLPPYDTRVQWAKLAIECELWPAAIEVLQQCEAEDDENGEVQYLLAIAWHMMGEDRGKKPVLEFASSPENMSLIGQGFEKSECWMEAKECIDICVQLHQRLGENSGLDDSILKHIAELNTQLQAAGITSKAVGDDADNTETVGEDDGNDDWESDVEMT